MCPDLLGDESCRDQMRSGSGFPSGPTGTRSSLRATEETDEDEEGGTGSGPGPGGLSGTSTRVRGCGPKVPRLLVARSTVLWFSLPRKVRDDVLDTSAPSLVGPPQVFLQGAPVCECTSGPPTSPVSGRHCRSFVIGFGTPVVSDPAPDYVLLDLPSPARLVAEPLLCRPLGPPVDLPMEIQ